MGSMVPGPRRALLLEPRPGPPAGQVGRIEALGHDPFVAVLGAHGEEGVAVAVPPVRRPRRPDQAESSRSSFRSTKRRPVRSSPARSRR
jgi:hypothetical protein